MKQKRIGPIKKRIFDPLSHKKNEENENSPVKIDRAGAEIQAHTHTYTHTHTHTYASIHIFQKSCILIPNTSKNNYNMFLQELKKLLSQSFL